MTAAAAAEPGWLVPEAPIRFRLWRSVGSPARGIYSGARFNPPAAAPVQASSGFAVLGTADGIDVERCAARFFTAGGQALAGRLITSARGGVLKAVFDCSETAAVVHVYLLPGAADSQTDWEPATGLLWETRGCSAKGVEGVVSAAAFRKAWDQAAAQTVETHAVPSTLINHLFERATDDAFLCRLSGALHVAKSGKYEFSTIAEGGRVFLSVNGQLVSTFDAAKGDSQTNTLQFDYPAGGKGKPRVVSEALLRDRNMRKWGLVTEDMEAGQQWRNPKWRKGRSGVIKLNAGLHRIELLRAAPPAGKRDTSRYGPLYCSATWVPPGAQTHDDRRNRRDPPIPASAFSPFASFRAIGTDTRDGTPAAAMLWRRVHDYRHNSGWRNNRHVLTLTTFKALVGDLSPSVRCRWLFDDGGVAEGREASHVFAVPGMHKVALELRDGDRLLKRAIAECSVDLCYDKTHDWVDARLRAVFNSAVVHEPFSRTPVSVLPRLYRFAEMAGETRWQSHLQHCVARRAEDLFPDHWMFGLDLVAAMMQPEFSNHEQAYAVCRAALKQLPSDHAGRMTARVLAAAYLIRVAGRIEDGLRALDPVPVLDLSGQWHVVCVPGEPLIVPPPKRGPKTFTFSLPKAAPALGGSGAAAAQWLKRGSIAWPAMLSAEDCARLKLTDRQSQQSVCFVRRFRGPERFTGRDLALCLGRPRGHCAAYLNGTLLGGGGTASTPDRITGAGLTLAVPRHAFKPGAENELIVRIGGCDWRQPVGINSKAIGLSPTGVNLDPDHVSLAHNLRVEALLALGREKQARDYLDLDTTQTEATRRPRTALRDFQAQLRASLRTKARLEHVRSLLRDGEAKASGKRLPGDAATITESEFYDKALSELKQALGENPDLRFDPDYQLLHSRVLVARREWLRALFTLDGLLKTGSPLMQQRPDALAEKVRVLTLLRRFDEARTLYAEMSAEPGMKYHAALAAAGAYLQAAALQRSTVKLVPRPGIHLAPPTIRLSVDDPAARIRYTFADADPTADSDRYIIPIKPPGRGRRVLRARAFVRGKPVGRVASGRYDILPDVADLCVPDLPLWAVPAMSGPPRSPASKKAGKLARKQRGKTDKRGPAAPPQLVLSLATEVFADRIVDDMAVRVPIDMPFTVPVPDDCNRFVALMAVDPGSAAQFSVLGVTAKDKKQSLATGTVSRHSGDESYTARFRTIDLQIPASVTALAVETQRRGPSRRSVYLLRAGFMKGTRK